MKYRCCNGHEFNSPMTIMEHTTKGVNGVKSDPGNLTITDWTDWMEETFQVCPECKTFNYETVEDPQPTNVYIYELTTGEQTKLDEILADGWIVKDKFSKQYHLWKCPAQKTETAMPEMKEAEVAYKKLDVHDQMEATIKSLKNQKPENIFSEVTTQ